MAHNYLDVSSNETLFLTTKQGSLQNCGNILNTTRICPAKIEIPSQQEGLQGLFQENMEQEDCIRTERDFTPVASCLF